MSNSYQIVRGDAQGLRDVLEFVDTLSKLEEHPAGDVRTLFDPQSEITIARAPGRLDVMGGIADYSGSLVLELPIAGSNFGRPAERRRAATQNSQHIGKRGANTEF